MVALDVLIYRLVPSGLLEITQKNVDCVCIFPTVKPTIPNGDRSDISLSQSLTATSNQRTLIWRELPLLRRPRTDPISSRIPTAYRMSPTRWRWMAGMESKYKLTKLWKLSMSIPVKMRWRSPICLATSLIQNLMIQWSIRMRW